MERHPKARYAHALARMANRLFLFGGESNAGAPAAGRLSLRPSPLFLAEMRPAM